ncbi:unnamed protein product [Trifolium pratense]|uniref:Uncharacterized protein n=1 Tax=Trifolium pratense TaxID=57577 RepID=A0ACB0LY38_TRIPR|nr:unnamed protein product [Trifolium pratense]
MAGNINYTVPIFDWSGKVFEEVQVHKKSLIFNREFTLLRVKAIDHKTEKVNDFVFEWLKETEILIQEVENLTVQASSRKWNELRKLLKKIMALNVKWDFEPLSTPIPSLEHFSSGNIVCFNSREKPSDQLLVALKDDSCSMIGLYGRQGSGKTTLVKAMGEKVKYLKIFQEVLFARASQNNIRRMQDEIADLLNLKFDKNSDAGRARRISSTIDSMNCPILVIFDDVRVKFDLEDVGIPYNSNRCKVLLTTCSQQDCDLMHTQKDIQLGPLSTEESWTLFQKHSGIHDEKYSASFDLLNVAREVAIECEGLPGTIKDVGSSLRSKPIEEWKTTLDSLKHSMAKWQIFLSFRGEDTRYTFTGSLYQALSQGRFKTFMDDGGGLDTGDQISPSLLNAIEASRLSIIVLSENYANSTWCLDELVKILECKKLKNQVVWPIFYKVEPSDIRHMRKSYGKDMSRHENTFGFNSERVQKWKSALSEVCNLSGKHYTTGYEYEFINTLVEDANRIRSRLQIRNRYVLE